MRRILIGYPLMLLVFGAGIYLVLERGRRLEVAVVHAAPNATSPEVRAPAARGGFVARLAQPLPRLLLQLMTIVLLARLLGAIFARMGQPAVIGEIVAGLVLGPSVLGSLFPAAGAFLFAPSSVGVLKLLAEIGVLLFLFLIGLKLDLDTLRLRTPRSPSVTPASSSRISSGSRWPSSSIATSLLPGSSSRRSPSSSVSR